MKAVIQRVRRSSVTIDGTVVGEIGPGLTLLLGVTEADTEKQCDYLAEKAVNLRIFEDDAGKMNRSLLDIGGGMLIISQFTLCADCRKGRRPSFIAAARPEQAVPLYERFIAQVQTQGVQTASGQFGADMLVSIENDGPVTIILDTEEIMPDTKC
ncbi:D-aminoacyl-tRNA deacylase [Clostridium sp. D33t1_170424_F3]|uniref:D-aminoacyl-tRNA deacylase n=1 Tax=Clostridium sp. D33t1_170424_F3 TaxID=2787099 RepID=UPI0018A96804|nr:D-aminoacyl-tRNA deacylase [Clostridium sp. D33t1_170424_F3]